MSLFPRISSRAWIFVLIGTCGFLLWINSVRLAHVEYVSGLVAPETAMDAQSPTGWANGLRRLIAPEHNNESYQWLAQTQQMIAQGDWRLRHVDYDNAPAGREVLSASPYRWWLGLMAWFDHLTSGRPMGLAVEHAALFADPVLHLLLLISVAVFTARQFGSIPASLLSVGLVTLFPLGGTFLPGQPNDGAMVAMCALWSVLPLLAGIGGRSTETKNPDETRANASRCFVVAGIAGGLGLWISVARQIPILAGIAVGAILATALTRRAAGENAGSAPEMSAAWRSWALAGAITSFAAYLIEYFPGHLAGVRLEQLHPLYSLAWLGLGELLARISEQMQKKRPPLTYSGIGIMVLAVLAVAAIPTLLLTKGADAFVADKVASTRLTNLAGSPIAPDLLAWISRDGFTTALAATLLPALLLLLAGWLIWRKQTNPAGRAMLALALGPVAVALAMATTELRWWSVFDGVVVALLLGVTVVLQSQLKTAAGRAAYFGAVVLGLVPGLILFAAQVSATARENLNESDVVALLERDLSCWLANRKPGTRTVVLAPPNLTTSFYFHGGLAGLGTPYWENKEGFLAAIRIAGATSPDEAQAVAQGRQLNYIVIPSWDGFLDEYARMGSNQPDHSLAAMLHRWLPPRWLRPVAYHLPKVAGFEGQSVAVFEVVEVQDNATALSHLAEYFVEMEQLDQAVALNRTLERLFPGDLSVAAARAHVYHAANNPTGLAATLNEIQTLISNGEDQMMPWDRRVSLAIALVEGKRFDPAREQVKHCLEELDEEKLRSLTTVSLYRLQVMTKAFGLGIADPRLHELALKLLPAEMRNGL